MLVKVGHGVMVTHEDRGTRSVLLFVVLERDRIIVVDRGTCSVPLSVMLSVTVSTWFGVNSQYRRHCVVMISFLVTPRVSALAGCDNLGLGELAYTKLIVDLTDRSVKYPKGIAENVLIGIGKFVFPVDFIILDMPEDIKVPLILRRPFLSIARPKIDVFK
ncbi:putative reverse transcriptase domain-containing protein [Tanacetum coccineum]